VLKARGDQHEFMLEAQAVEHAAQMEQMEKEADRTAEGMKGLRVAEADPGLAVAKSNTKEHSAAEGYSSELQSSKSFKQARRQVVMCIWAEGGGRLSYKQRMKGGPTELGQYV
jgi:hypothetical protein